MSPDEIQIVQRSYGLIEARRDEVAAAFYAQLFSTAPELRSMFPDSMDVQREKLMRTLAVLVRGLDDFGTLMHVASALAGRHVDYGVTERHYELAGDALMSSLDETLGDELTPALADAWVAVYGRISSTMVRAAYPASVESAAAGVH